MKYFSTCLLFILFIPLFLFAQQPDPNTRKALIIAIGDYPESGGWHKISSLNDVPYIKKTLIKQGFTENNIDTLFNEQASIGGIKNALVRLIQKVNNGDIVVLHISSHGEQVQADNNNKIDQLDECVVTYNAIAPSKNAVFSKDTSEYLRGHVLGDYIRQLRSKAGRNGDVIVFMDNCHSGDGTRGVAKVRGAEAPLVSKDFNLQKSVRSDSSIIFREAIQKNIDESKMASYEVISATRPEEIDTETIDDYGKEVGPLSYAIYKAFEKLSAENTSPTYRGLFAQIQSIMNIKVQGQHPLLEGNGSDRQIFGGELVHQMPYIELDKIDNDKLTITLTQGSIAGLSPGSKIAIYPSNTHDTSKAKPIAIGIVEKSDHFSAIAKISKRLEKIQPAEAWAFVTEYMYAITPVKIKLNNKKLRQTELTYNSQDISFVGRYLKNHSFIEFSENPDLIVIKGEEQDSIKVNSNGYLFSTVKNITQDSLDLITKLESYARYKYLQNLSGKSNGLSVEVKLILVKNLQPDVKATTARMLNGSFTTFIGDTITISIKNTGTRDAYVNILDMQPNGIINAFLPNQALQIYKHDLLIKAGQEYQFPVDKGIRIGPPLGREVFKIFASDKEIDLEQINTSGLAARKGDPPTALEKLIAKSFDLSKNDLEVEVISIAAPESESTISELVFDIRPRK